MAQLYLPAAHTEADLVLAGQIAECVDSEALYVAWTPAHGRAVPEVLAELRAPAVRWTDTIALVFEAVRELWSLALGRGIARPVVTAADEPEGDEPVRPATGEAAA